MLGIIRDQVSSFPLRAGPALKPGIKISIQFLKRDYKDYWYRIVKLSWESISEQSIFTWTLVKIKESTFSTMLELGLDLDFKSGAKSLMKLSISQRNVQMTFNKLPTRRKVDSTISRLLFKTWLFEVSNCLSQMRARLPPPIAPVQKRDETQIEM